MQRISHFRFDWHRHRCQTFSKCIKWDNKLCKVIMKKPFLKIYDLQMLLITMVLSSKHNLSCKVIVQYALLSVQYFRTSLKFCKGKSVIMLLSKSSFRNKISPPGNFKETLRVFFFFLL